MRKGKNTKRSLEKSKEKKKTKVDKKVRVKLQSIGIAVVTPDHYTTTSRTV